jgi:hypothetical protein
LTVRLSKIALLAEISVGNAVTAEVAPGTSHRATVFAKVNAIVSAVVAFLCTIDRAIAAARPEAALGSAASVRAVENAVVTLFTRLDNAIPADGLA